MVKWTDRQTDRDLLMFFFIISINFKKKKKSCTYNKYQGFKKINLTSLLNQSPVASVSSGFAGLADLQTHPWAPGSQHNDGCTVAFRCQ